MVTPAQCFAIYQSVPASPELIHRMVMIESWDDAYALFKATAYSPQLLKDTLYTATLKAHHREEDNSAVRFVGRLIGCWTICQAWL